MVQTLLAVYDDLSMAQHAVQDLVQSGISRENISLVANDVSEQYVSHLGKSPVETDVVGPEEGASFGAVVGALTGAVVSIGALAIPGVGTVLAAGPLLAVLTGGTVGAVTGAATGGIVAGLVKTGIPENEAQGYAEAVRRGGTLVTVTTEDSTATSIREILARHDPVDIEQRAEIWREGGWKAFDEVGQPYAPDEIHRERDSYRNLVDQKAHAQSAVRAVRSYDSSARV